MRAPASIAPRVACARLHHTTRSERVSRQGQSVAVAGQGARTLPWLALGREGRRARRLRRRLDAAALRWRRVWRRRVLLRLRLVVLRARERCVSVAALLAVCTCALRCAYLRLRLRLSRQARLLSIAAGASRLAADEARLEVGLEGGDEAVGLERVEDLLRCTRVGRSRRKTVGERVGRDAPLALRPPLPPTTLAEKQRQRERCVLCARALSNTSAMCFVV